MIWQTIQAPPGVAPPKPMTVRVQSIPARHYFPKHAHRWHQVVYAMSGVLTVAVDGRSFVISPEQAVWLPIGLQHQVGSLFGAEFRSLWIAETAGHGLPANPTVFAVTPLLRELIIEAATIEGDEEKHDGYPTRVTCLIFDQLRRARSLPGALPWPRGGSLATLCEALYADPADARGSETWGRELGMSGRTLARRFDAELGMSLRSWRRRLRLF
jgi:AraC-like DNA-binding protein